MDINLEALMVRCLEILAHENAKDDGPFSRVQESLSGAEAAFRFKNDPKGFVEALRNDLQTFLDSETPPPWGFARQEGRPAHPERAARPAGPSPSQPPAEVEGMMTSTGKAVAFTSKRATGRHRIFHRKPNCTKLVRRNRKIRGITQRNLAARGPDVRFCSFCTPSSNKVAPGGAAA